KGERGLELAIFRSKDGGENFEKIVSFSKSDLNIQSHKVISIEGASLNMKGKTVELYVSTEKEKEYPPGFEQYRKPGTGVWSIDRIVADSVENLKKGRLEPFLDSQDPLHLHIKDPTLVHYPSGKEVLIFCTHPYTWASTNSGFMIRDGKDFDLPIFDFFSRGLAWDIAVTRITDILPLLPSYGFLPDTVNLVIYDGAECLRPHDENVKAVKRPRGYSCEEIGGVAWFPAEDLEKIERLSANTPLFFSPYGTGCSRYVHTCVGKKGIYATWQQSQPTGAQPLVVHRLDWEDVHKLLT
ncbi:MAG: hypothetical protein SNJ78_12880, partial [Spirochaetales bacterium]